VNPLLTPGLALVSTWSVVNGVVECVWPRAKKRKAREPRKLSAPAPAAPAKGDRWRILEAIQAGATQAPDIAALLRIPRVRVWTHLRGLKRAGLIRLVNGHWRPRKCR
jgi:hypothetical protein